MGTLSTHVPWQQSESCPQVPVAGTHAPHTFVDRQRFGGAQLHGTPPQATVPFWQVVAHWLWPRL